MGGSSSSSKDHGREILQHGGGTYSSHLSCPICHALLENPVVLVSCGHMYCEGCIQLWFDAQTHQRKGSKRLLQAFKCPTCHSTCPPLFDEETGNPKPPFTPVFALRQFLANLPVMCCQEVEEETSLCRVAVSEGKRKSQKSQTATNSRRRQRKQQRYCGWTGRWCDWKNHVISQCPYTVIICPDPACEARLLRGDLARHQRAHQLARGLLNPGNQTPAELIAVALCLLWDHASRQVSLVARETLTLMNGTECQNPPKESTSSWRLFCSWWGKRFIPSSWQEWGSSWWFGTEEKWKMPPATTSQELSVNLTPVPLVALRSH